MIAKKRSYHTLRDFFLVVFKHKTVIALFFMVCVLAAVASTFMITPVYESSIKLLVQTPSPAETGSAADKDKATVIDTAVELMTGRYLIEKVIREFGIDRLYPDLTDTGILERFSKLEKAIIRFQKDLAIQKGNIIEISFCHRDPKLAAAVLNNLIDAFLDYYLEIQKQDEKYNFFKQQAQLMKQRLEQSQKELGLFRNERKISSIKKQKSLLLLQISDLEIELSKAQAEISKLEGLAESVQQGTEERQQIARERIALKSKAKKLQQQIASYRLQLNRLDKAETRLHELERQVRLDEENYLLYAKKTEEARISSAKEQQKIIHFTVIEPALPPITPVKTQQFRIIGIAVIVSLIGGVLLAFMCEYFSHTFDNLNDIEEILKSAGIAAYPELAPSQLSRVQAGTLPERFMEESSRIMHHAARMFPDSSSKSLLFSSPNMHEGSSTVLFSVARTLADNGEDVLLVDTNLRQPCLHRLLQLDQGPGVAEAVLEKKAVDDYIRASGIDNLRVITSGSTRSNPFALLQSEFFEDFLRDVSAKAGWVLFDAPPIAPVNDVCLIAPKLNGVVMVVKAGKTRWEVARSSMVRLKQCNAHLFGIVLNRQKRYIPAWLYHRL